MSFDIKKDIAVINSLKKQGKTIVFTNGCFDLLHPGHVDYLKKARELGDYLVVGLNEDRSITRLKGTDRPINNLHFRKTLLEAFSFVDIVIPFEEDTPKELISKVQPDVLVKGADYQIEDIVGADLVLAYGGQVLQIAFLEGFSSSKIIEKIKALK